MESNRSLFDKLAGLIVDDERNRKIVDITLAAAGIKAFHILKDAYIYICIYIYIY